MKTLNLISQSATCSCLAGVAAAVKFTENNNEGEDMKLINVEMLKDLSAEDMERLRKDIKKLDRRIRDELSRMERYCAHCGDQLGSSVYGYRYCSAWHRYLDAHKNAATVSRVEFERKRAISRIRTIKKAMETGSTQSNNSILEGAAGLKTSLKNLRIRRILNEYQTITGESLKKSIRDNRRFKATGQ